MAKAKWIVPKWSETFKLKREKDPIQGVGRVFYLGEKAIEKYVDLIETLALPYQKEKLLKIEKDWVHFTGSEGPVWILRRSKKVESSHHGIFAETLYTQARDNAGHLLQGFRLAFIQKVLVELWGTTRDEELGFVVGLDLSAYTFRSVYEGTFEMKSLPQVVLNVGDQGFASSTLKEAQAIAFAVNWSRHLVNLPAQDLNPHEFEVLCEEHFKKSKTMKVIVWDEYRLQKEKMNLHLAVGQGSHFGPRMIHLRYRPLLSRKKKPMAVVGKGITFDTGGLDLKPSSAMRLMKKDMGGAASVFGLALWLEMRGVNQPCDLYLAIAENSIGPKAFRPGDIFVSRSGVSVEIHNTDAEGRLVLADVLDVAIKNKETPEAVVDLATLTGAIKGALGADIPGLFSNNDNLAQRVESAAAERGETCWRMPLVPRYRSQMASSVASMTNAVDGFGGAITAALFLETFVGSVPWAHLDIYAWNDRPQGGLSMAGGNGQGVQTMIKLVEDWESLKK